ncbi:hypothetical protein ST37_01830 (plasmid) [Vibrio sp. qd031]|uniref:hypothetical protein n=1 Tax=Vibrio sp. qd031 TaxID=1603038 RepID=UPI000A1144A1|nr:hypothetical protein [Vibrio sp. qd031]ORT52532.1 hypothetical protein ST37_01830 [Vibrio sp. qd031]
MQALESTRVEWYRCYFEADVTGLAKIELPTFYLTEFGRTQTGTKNRYREISARKASNRWFPTGTTKIENISINYVSDGSATIVGTGTITTPCGEENRARFEETWLFCHGVWMISSLTIW